MEVTGTEQLFESLILEEPVDILRCWPCGQLQLSLRLSPTVPWDPCLGQALSSGEMHTGPFLFWEKAEVRQLHSQTTLGQMPSSLGQPQDSQSPLGLDADS
jgi:hypothetical protein